MSEIMDMVESELRQLDFLLQELEVYMDGSWEILIDENNLEESIYLREMHKFHQKAYYEIKECVSRVKVQFQSLKQGLCCV